MANQYQYDSLNRLTNLTWNLSVSTLAKFSYLLGATGNRTNLNETVNSTSRTYQWQYDGLYRLTNEAIGITAPGNLFYQYDTVGNRTNRTSSVTGLGNQNLAYNTNDWLVTDTNDANGNTINSSGANYEYDALNHMTNATVNGAQILMTYDGDGNRVSKTVSGTTTYYLVDDVNPGGYSQVLEEYRGSTLTNVYNYGLSLISQRKAGISTNYFISDGHGSTRMLTDNAGTVVNVLVYDAYGNLIASSGNPQTAYLYSGQQYDFDLGLYLNRARYLSTGTGRFWTADSTEGDNEDPLSLHRYLYAADDPVNNADPSGNNYGDFNINISSIGSLLATVGTPVTSESGLGEYTPVASANLEKFGFSSWSDGFCWYMVADVWRIMPYRYFVVQYQKGRLSINGKPIKVLKSGDPVDGRWHIDAYPYRGDHDIVESAMGEPGQSGYVLKNNDQELRYLDTPGFESSLRQGYTILFDVRFRIIVYDMYQTPPKAVKRSNILHLKASGMWPRLNYNGP